MGALESFWAALATDADTALYSYRHVRVAVDRAAAATVLVCDSLLRSRLPAGEKEEKEEEEEEEG